MLTIEINAADSGVESRNVQTKNGPQTFYHQTAYLHRPGVAYPDRFRLPVRSPAEAYPPGRFTLGDGSYRVGRYGDLEINRFEMSLVPCDSQAPAQDSKGTTDKSSSADSGARQPRVVNS